MEALRAFMSIASKKKGFQPCDLQQADVVTAFLQADLLSDEGVFVYPPKEHPDYEKVIWKMRKAGNGLCDSPRCWLIHSELVNASSQILNGSEPYSRGCTSEKGIMQSMVLYLFGWMIFWFVLD